MDRPDNDVADLRSALVDLSSINRLLGGRRALRRAIRPWIDRQTDTPLRILDVGTGGADLPLDIVRQARRVGRDVSVTAIDLDPGTTSVAAEQTRDVPEIRVVRADAFAPPFAPRTFHLVTASLFFHHFRHDEIVRLLETMRRLASDAVLINDLRRHRVPWFFIHVAARAARLHPMVVHDGPLSVLRGFTDDELKRAADDAGAPGATISRSWPYRLILTVPPGGPT